MPRVTFFASAFSLLVGLHFLKYHVLPYQQAGTPSSQEAAMLPHSSVGRCAAAITATLPPRLFVSSQDNTRGQIGRLRVMVAVSWVGLEVQTCYHQINGRSNRMLCEGGMSSR